MHWSDPFKEACFWRTLHQLEVFEDSNVAWSFELSVKRKWPRGAPASKDDVCDDSHGLGAEFRALSDPQKRPRGRRRQRMEEQGSNDDFK